MTQRESIASAQRSRAAARTARPAVVVEEVSRAFGSTVALAGVSLDVRAGEIHALLGPNGAGKTTLLRLLTGLVESDAGEIDVYGLPVDPRNARLIKTMLTLVPSGDRTFYLRLSGFENLLFFGRMHGLRKNEAARRARAGLEAVGLEDAEGRRVGLYSHGMQKRLSLARSLLLEPRVLLVDEVTHDLDPAASERARGLVSEVASRGAAVLWTTQRVDEIRGFADRTTVLDHGRTVFSGSVPELMAFAVPSRFLIHLRDSRGGRSLEDEARQALRGIADVEASGEVGGEHFTMELSGTAVLGDAVSELARHGMDVLACREERSAIEEAFLRLTKR